MKYVIETEYNDQRLWYAPDPITLWTSNLQLAERFNTKFDADVKINELRLRYDSLRTDETLRIMSIGE